jgi:RNA polymerase sigma-70 factor (ECF subfamily)
MVGAPEDLDAALVAGLRAGDEQTFATLVDRYHASLVRVARAYVVTKEAAEDVAQETWLGVIRGIDRFEGRSSLKTWIFRIAINRAMTRGSREARSLPFSSLGPDEPAVEPTRFLDSGRWAGYWSDPPKASERPEEHVLTGEARAVVEAAIAALPDQQRLVITLRDVQGFTAAEACDLLGVSDANQRVLLHRARSRVRAVLERELAGVEA